MYDSGCFEASGDNGLTEGDVLLAHKAQVLSTCPRMLSGPPAFHGLTLVRVLHVSAALILRAGMIDGGEGPALPLVVRFGASKHAKKLLSLSGREASSSMTPCLDLYCE